MTYKEISDIFYIMREQERDICTLDEIRINLRKKGRMQEAEMISNAQCYLTATILKYHTLISEYAESEGALIEDFTDEINEFLEYNNYFPYMEWNEYKYSREAIQEEKQEIFKDFTYTLYYIIIENNFHTEDKAIQAFINNYSKLDLYLYILTM